MHFTKNRAAVRLTKSEYVGDDRHIFATKRLAESIQMHSHEFFEIEIALSGVGTQRINGTEYPIRPGSISLLTPADFHEVRVLDRLMLWNISFDENLLTERQQQSIILSDSPSLTVEPEVFRQLHTAAELISRETDERAAMHLLSFLLEKILPKEDKSAGLTEVKRAILYIRTHFREHPSLSDVAEQVYLSAAYFGDIFKKETGQTYIQYLNRCKIGCACMLLDSGYSVRDACFESGFGSLSNFLYTFKKYKGCAPDRYRQSTMEEAQDIEKGFSHQSLQNS